MYETNVVREGARGRGGRRPRRRARSSAVLREADRAGGEERQGGGRDEKWLTQADSERTTSETRLLGAFPDDGWLSEETKDSPARLEKSRVWIVDPLDGTREFTLRVPEFCVCIALVENGKPVVGVEYNPATDRLYSAALGAGTTLNGAPARVSKTEHIALAQVLASRSEDKRGEWDPFKRTATSC